MDWRQLTNDFRQKYEKCWCSVLVEGYKKPQVFYLEFVEETGKAPLLHLSNSQFGEIILKYDESGSDMDWKLPAIGLYNYCNGLIMLRRTYGKQYRKGICTGTVLITSVYRQFYSGFTLSSDDQLCDSMVEILLKPTPMISLKEGIDALTKNLAVALSSEFGIGLSPRDERAHILFYHENPIGTVDPERHQIFLREGQFQQEFLDFVAKIKGAHDFTIRS